MKFNKENVDKLLFASVDALRDLVIAIGNFMEAETQEEAWEIEDNEITPRLTIFDSKYTQLANLLKGHTIDELGLNPIDELMLAKLLGELMDKASEVNDVLINLSE